LPASSGHLMDFIAEVNGQRPLLGICLGHQAIVQQFGGKLSNLEAVLHGTVRTTRLIVDDDPVFKGMPSEFETGHYHSWVADAAFFPDCLRVMAVDQAGLIMAFRHREEDTIGLQFHPESILTPFGPRILKNWVDS
ncbi:MAG: anthranilate synthase component II, partial [Bacteroidota bacterium]